MSILPVPGVISFARGVPAPEMFPVDELAEASRRAFSKHSETALNYGAPGGFPPLQEWIARQHAAQPGQVVISPGSWALLAILVRALARPGAPVLMEAPSYDRMTSVLRRTGARVVPVRHGLDGLDLDELEDVLQGCLRASQRPAFFYVMPSFHNPTGTTMSGPDRERLADLAIRHDLLLIEDDPYGLLRWDGEVPASLRDLLMARGAGHLSIFTSSFSKTVAPGLRVGYGVLPDALVSSVATMALDAYVSPPLWPQAVVYEFLAAGFLPPHLARIRDLLRLRRDALAGRLGAGLDGLARWSMPDGGYFLWLELPCGLSAVDLHADCERAGVTFVPGPGFFTAGGGQNAARLSFSYPSAGDIRAGADRLVAAVRGRLVSAGGR
ncbi:MAG: PLP-dependent aminotransferase family protein [Streptosporangiaceae bacterium]